jgi:hypothetical protein
VVQGVRARRRSRPRTTGCSLPWGTGLTDTFELAVRVGTFAHAIAWTRQRDNLPESFRPRFDSAFAIILRRAVALTDESASRGES